MRPTSFTAFVKSLTMGERLRITNYKLPHLSRECELLSKTNEGILVTKLNGEAGHIKWPPAQRTNVVDDGIELVDAQGFTWLRVSRL